MRLRRPLLMLTAAALVAGCGTDAGAPGSTAAGGAPSAAAPAGLVPVSVTVPDGMDDSPLGTRPAGAGPARMDDVGVRAGAVGPARRLGAGRHAAGLGAGGRLGGAADAGRPRHGDRGRAARRAQPAARAHLRRDDPVRRAERPGGRLLLRRRRRRPTRGPSSPGCPTPAARTCGAGTRTRSRAWPSAPTARSTCPSAPPATSPSTTSPPPRPGRPSCASRPVAGRPSPTPSACATGPASRSPRTERCGRRSTTATTSSTPSTGPTASDSGSSQGQVIPEYVRDHPAEALARLTPGRNLGWPYCNPDPDVDPGMAGSAQDLSDVPFTVDVQTNPDGRALDCATLPAVEQALGGHSAPLGLSFVDGGLPDPYAQRRPRRGARLVERARRRARRRCRSSPGRTARWAPSRPWSAGSRPRTAPGGAAPWPRSPAPTAPCTSPTTRPAPCTA